MGIILTFHSLFSSRGTYLKKISTRFEIESPWKNFSDKVSQQSGRRSATTQISLNLWCVLKRKKWFTCNIWTGSVLGIQYLFLKNSWIFPSVFKTSFLMNFFTSLTSENFLPDRKAQRRLCSGATAKWDTSSRTRIPFSRCDTPRKSLLAKASSATILSQSMARPSQPKWNRSLITCNICHFRLFHLEKILLVNFYKTVFPDFHLQ